MPLLLSREALHGVKDSREKDEVDRLDRSCFSLSNRRGLFLSTWLAVAARGGSPAQRFASRTSHCSRAGGRLSRQRWAFLTLIAPWPSIL